MFKTKNIYSLKERAMRDIRKGSKRDWQLIAIIVILVISAFIPWKNVRAVDIQDYRVKALLQEKVLEDYSESLLTSFNGLWASTPKAEWKIPQNVLVGPYNEYQMYWMNYAWERWHDSEFMLMLKAENGLLNHDRRHTASNAVGVDWGFCGTNDYWHSETVNDPRFFSDPEWQLEKCYEMFQDGTTFYAYNRVKNEPAFRAKIESHFNFN